MSSRTNSENKKMASITRKINHSFLGKFIWNTLKMDVLVLLVGVIIWIYAAEKAVVGEFKFDTKRQVLFGTENNFLEYILTDEEGTVKTLVITGEEAKVILWVMIGVLAIEFISVLLTSANMENTINRKLKPIREMARETEKISSMALDERYFGTLENAIEHVNATSPDARVNTGNKELQGIENALNNLLERMRESHRQQSRFVSDASHELRTPIAVISGYADMLDRWGKADESILDESIEAIKKESAHMQKLVEQLLFLARGDSGRNTLQIEKFSLCELMREVYEESLMIDERHRYEFIGEAAEMAGDVSMIKQSARILIDNAAKYTEEGDVITIRTGLEKEGCFFSIQDNGIGMSEADVSHIFERFYRSDKARNSKTGGTGLGLSIAKWIVDRHDGYFNILTRPDIGTRITVVFRNGEQPVQEKGTDGQKQGKTLAGKGE